MATFFDPDQLPDRLLLHEDVRDHAAVQEIVDEVEIDIVDHYTAAGQPTLEERVGGVSAYLFYYAENNQWYTVQLLGYDETLTKAAGYDADRDSWSGFAKAMRECIGHVASYRLRHYDDSYGLNSESRGRRSWDYGGGRDLRWPRHWKRRLKKYDTKPPVLL